MPLRRSGEDDQTIGAALERLWPLVDVTYAPDGHDVVVVDDLDGAFGAVRGTPKRIYIDARSCFYRLAELGDLLPLVMLLHHEAWHVVHGPSEAEAYAASAAFLRDSGIGPLRPDLVAEVESAARAAVRAGARPSELDN